MKTINVFKRKERKYLLDRDVAEEIMKKLDDMLYRKKFKKNIEETYIRSLYFDSDDFMCYRDHKNKEKSRFKIRMRRYGNGKDFFKKCFVEMKEKNNGMNYKHRFKIKEKWAGGFIQENIDYDKLLRYNEIDSTTLDPIYSEINEKLMSNQLHPVLQVEYHRRAYENSEGSVRITFDDQLSFRLRQSIEMPTDEVYQFPGDKVIMETKTLGTRPYWLMWLLKKYGLKRQSFSKYTAGIETVYAESNCINRILKETEEEVIHNG